MTQWSGEDKPPRTLHPTRDEAVGGLRRGDVAGDGGDVEKASDRRERLGCDGWRVILAHVRVLLLEGVTAIALVAQPS